MAITQAQILALHTSLQARFNKGLVVQSEDWKKIAKYIKSDGPSNTYAWLTQFPAFREWVGSRLHKQVAENAYTVDNKLFENTLDVPRTDIEDDMVGLYGDLAESYGQSVLDLKNSLMYQALKAGFNTNCYDGQYFFDTDHPVAANEDGTGAIVNVSNVQAGAGEAWVLLCTKRAPAPLYLQERITPQFESITTTQNSNVFDLDKFSFGGRWRGNAAYGFWQLAYGSKAALDATNFQAAYAAMIKVKGDGQRLLGVVPDTLVVGPDNQAAAEALLKANQNAAGASNINYNKVELVVTPWLGN